MAQFRKRLIFFAWLLLQYSSYGQDYLTNLRHISIQDGLSHAEVYAIHLDHRGLIWLGTKFGLNRYDGYGFKQWTEVQDSLATNTIHQLLEDQSGWIWAFTFKDRLFQKEIVHISLVHSITGAVKNIKVLAHKPPFKWSEVIRLFSDNHRNLYFVTQDGSWKYQPKLGFQKLKAPSDILPVQAIEDEHFIGIQHKTLVEFDKDGKLLGTLLKNPSISEYLNKRSTYGNGKLIWERVHETNLVFAKNGDPSLRETSPAMKLFVESVCYFDQKRNWLWAAQHRQLIAFDQDGKKVFDISRYLKANFKNAVLSMFVDEKGLVWLGTDNGLYLLEVKPNPFVRYLYQYPENKSLDELYRCRGIVEHNGQLFVNTYFGGVRVDMKANSAYKVNRPPVADFNTGHFLLHKEKDGTIWTANNHLSRMDPQTGLVQQTYFIPGLGSEAWAIYRDRSGTIWVDKGAGLYFLKDGKIQPFKAYNGFAALQTSTVYAYHEDRNGKIWLGTASGLYVLDPLQGITERYFPGGQGDFYLPGTQIQFIHEDAEGVFWLATENDGLIKWHPKTKETTQLKRLNGLPSNTIYCVYEEVGKLWMSSDFGIIQLDKKTLKAKTFLPEDGTSYHEFNRMSHYRAADGRLYFGSQNGVTAFYPKDLIGEKMADALPKLSVYEYVEGRHFNTEMVENTAMLALSDKIELHHDVRMLAFKIVSQDYFSATKTRFFYRMETLNHDRNSPFTGDWIPCDGNEVRIMGITPGAYRLSIEARTLAGELVSEPMVYEITMPPPFYKTLWFKALLLLLAVGGTWAFMKNRTRRLEERQLLLEKMVAERTQQILKDQEIIEEQAAQIRKLDNLLNDADQRWKEQLDEVVRQKLADFDLNIADLADEMHLSRTHFFRKIKTVTGMTPNQYLQEARLAEAKSLLETGRYDSVKAVSYSVGFKQAGYFARIFKEKYGISPTGYFNEN